MTDPSWLTQKRLEEWRTALVADYGEKGSTATELNAIIDMALYAIEAKEREAKPCEKCMGKGRVPVDYPAIQVAPGVYEQKAVLFLGPCPACNGTGRK